MQLTYSSKYFCTYLTIKIRRRKNVVLTKIELIRCLKPKNLMQEKAMYTKKKYRRNTQQLCAVNKNLILKHEYYTVWSKAKGAKPAKCMRS
jgi:hypothetical protein